MGQLLSRPFASTRLQSDGEKGVSRRRTIRERCLYGADFSREIDDRIIREEAYPDLESISEQPVTWNALSPRRQPLGRETTPSAPFAALLDFDHIPRRNRSRPRNTGTAQRTTFRIPSTSSRRSRREVRPYDGPNNSRTTLGAAALNREEHSRTRNTSTAQSNRPHDLGSQATDSNIGTPRRQEKYVRGRNSEEGPESMTHDRHRTRHWSNFVPTIILGDPSKYHDNDRGYQSDESLPANILGVAHNQNKQVLKKKSIGKECVVCTEHRSLRRFPNRTPTKRCTHDIDVCRRCLRTWIESEFSTKMWDEINCPICSKRLEYDDMNKFAPTEVFCRYVSALVINTPKTAKIQLKRSSYKRLSIKASREAVPNFRWCINKGCNSGQVHRSGKPKFCCKTCRAKHCVKHTVPWHKGETCTEYDYR
jgi:hypothetical protein